MADHAFGSGGNLPVEPAGFVGRTGLLAGLRGHVRDSGLVTITGIAGVGKSRLALRFAHASRALFRDGVWFVDLSELRDPDAVGHAVAATLGEPSLTALVDRVRGRDMLLVLDTCEHVVRPCAELAEKLLETGTDLRIVATSRCPLGARDERVVPVPPLPASDRDLLSDDAVNLFALAAPTFSLDEHTAASVAKICRCLDGLPLAIELAAAQLRTMSLERIAARLADGLSLDLLTRSEKSLPPRRRSMREAVAWSYDLCEPAERLLWARLSVFAGDFDLEAARIVCGDGRLPPQEIDNLVDALVKKSVLLIRSDYQGTRDNTRYRLISPIEAYAAERLEDLRESRDLRHAHLHYYLGLAARGEADWSGPRQIYWVERMRQEHRNVRAALEHALRTPEVAALALKLLSSLWFMWICCGFADEGRRYLRKALTANPAPSKARCKAMWVLSYVHSAQGDAMDAMSMAEQCALEAGTVGASKAVILACKMTGTAALLMGDYPKAIAMLGVVLKVPADDKELNPGLLPAIVELSIVLAQQGALPEAESLLLDCLKTCKDSGERFVRSYAYWALSTTHLAMGKIDEALQAIRKCLRIKRFFHDPLGRLMALETAARIHLELADPTVSAQLLGALRQNWKSAGQSRLGAPWLTAAHDRLVRECHAALGADAFGGAFDIGMGLDLDEASALALGTPEELTRLEIRVSGAGLAEVEAAVENLLDRHNFDLQARGGGYGLRFRDDAGGVTEEQLLEDLDHALREESPRDEAVTGLLTVMKEVGCAVVLINRTLVLEARGEAEVRRLSSAECAFLHSRPKLFGDPQALVRELRQLVAEVAVTGPRQIPREHFKIIIDCLGTEVADALESWAAQEGYEISVSEPVWTNRGNTDSRLLCLLIKRSAGSDKATRKVIAKLCPGRLSREKDKHQAAWSASAEGFGRNHLVRLVSDPVSLGETVGCVLFLEVAGGSLVSMRQMAELTSHDEIAKAFEAVVSGTLRDWNPHKPVVCSELNSGQYLRAELRERFASDSKLRTWAQDLGMLEPERRWLLFSGEQFAELLPNPLAMVAGHLVGRHRVQHLRGLSHGDLHHGNILIPRRSGDLEVDKFRLVDLADFELSAPLSRDVAALFHSLLVSHIPSDPVAQEDLLQQIAGGSGRDDLVARLMRTLYDEREPALIPHGFHDDWRTQLQLSALAAALIQCTFHDRDEQTKWWFFRLAAKYGDAYLRATSSWHPPEGTVPVVKIEDMRGFDMRRR